MKVYIHYALVLLIITALACGILAIVNEKTSPIIEANMKEEENKARNEVIEGADIFEKQALSNGSEYYVAKDKDDNLLGYTFIAIGKGYSSDVQTMVGINTNFRITKIIIIQQSETPGLGANCTKPEFSEKFHNLKTEDLLVDKDGGTIKSMTGATITTRTITKSIRQQLEQLEKEIVGVNFISGGER
ncbi:MAG: FMN-binding protein [Candidatus Cloacimonetes bacterium]|nr:FMN-binding protein [Candidatus Cloacimonadota bacterium]MDD2650778.1 FMN-binding protein [Candidatus Cloacimonadota bacterium]